MPLQVQRRIASAAGEQDRKAPVRLAHNVNYEDVTPRLAPVNL
jgi:hypothetical protein